MDSAWLVRVSECLFAALRGAWFVLLAATAAMAAMDTGRDPNLKLCEKCNKP